MITDKNSERFLGDPRFYTKSVLRNPPIEDEFLKIYKDKFGVGPDEPRKFARFLKSSQLLDFLCEFDLNLFCERVLGHIVRPFHVEWANMVEGSRRIILFAPRDFGKSQFVRDYVLWCSYYKKRVNILIISETISQAKNVLSGEDSVKEQIMNNPALEHLEPKGSQGKWSETLLQLSNGVRIEIAGYGQRLRGRHPDLILLDDVLSDQNSGTPEMRKKVFHEYTHTIYPMAKKYTKLFIVGTAHHPDDLLHYLGKQNGYAYKKYRAVNEETKESLWPERHSYESLQEVRRIHGEMAYQREYQNNPISDTLRFFPDEVLNNCKDPDRSYVTYYSGPNLIHFGGDLSPPGGAKSGRGDYTVYVIFELDKNDCLNLLTYERFRDEPNSKELFFERQLKQMQTLCNRYRVDHGYLEEVGFQGIYTREFIKKTSVMPISGYGVTHAGKKSLTAGIPYIRGLMEKRKIRLPYKDQSDRDLTDQFLRDFSGMMLLDNGKIGNTSYHDDTVIATWMAVESSKALSRPMFTMDNPFRSSKVRTPRYRGTGRFKGIKGRKK